MTTTTSKLKVTPTFQRRAYIEYTPNRDDFDIKRESPTDSSYQGCINISGQISVRLKEELEEQLTAYKRESGIPTAYQNFAKYSDFRGCKTTASKEKKRQKILTEVRDDYKNNKEAVTEKLIQKHISDLNEWVRQNNQNAYSRDVRDIPKLWDGEDIDKKIPAIKDLNKQREDTLAILKGLETSIVAMRNAHMLASLEGSNWSIKVNGDDPKTKRINIHPEVIETLTNEMKENKHFGFEKFWVS